jgi:hypothetical protein
VLVLFAATLSASCNWINGLPEAQACKAYYENFFGQKLTFSPRSAEISDAATTFSALKKQHYKEPLTDLEKAKLDLVEKRNLGIRTVSIRSEHSSFVEGIPLNGLVCEFLLVDSKIQDSERLVGDMQTRASEARLSQLAEASGDRELVEATKRWRDRTPPGCCLP